LTVAAGPYDAVVRGLISAHKERQALTLTGFLAGRLTLSVRRLLEESAWPLSGPVLLVPVPSAQAAVRERGLDATAALARGAARRLDPTRPARVRRLLAQRRPVRDQAGLSAADRASNLRGGIAVRRRPAVEERVILVDDVVTTGSSLTEAVRALTAAGISVLGAATVAATVRRRPGPDRGVLKGRKHHRHP
jgi:predicted amidophosphoribosyltransferase